MVLDAAEQVAEAQGTHRSNGVTLTHQLKTLLPLAVGAAKALLRPFCCGRDSLIGLGPQKCCRVSQGQSRCRDAP